MFKHHFKQCSFTLFILVSIGILHFILQNSVNCQTLRNQNLLEPSKYQTYSSPKYGYYDIFYMIIPKNSVVKVNIGSSDSLTSYFRLNSIPTQIFYDEKFSRCGNCQFSQKFSKNSFNSNSSISYHTLYIAIAAERSTYYTYGITGYVFPTDYLINVNSGKSVTATIMKVESWAFYQVTSPDLVITINRGIDFGFEFYAQSFPNTNTEENIFFNTKLEFTETAYNLGTNTFIAVVNRGRNQTLSIDKSMESQLKSQNMDQKEGVEVLHFNDNKRDHYPFETYKFTISSKSLDPIISGAVNSFIVIVYAIPFVCCCIVCGCCCFFIYRIKRTN